MKKPYLELISELMSLLSDDEKVSCQNVFDCLTELGYVPQKQKAKSCYVLSFKNNRFRQTIAKIGVRNSVDNRAFYSIKFYACKNPPQKFSQAVQYAILKSNTQYICADCGICGADKDVRGYHYTYPDGTVFVRCAAYVVEIPDLTSEDIEDFNNLLAEQHAYFSTRAKQVLCG